MIYLSSQTSRLLAVLRRIDSLRESIKAKYGFPNDKNLLKKSTVSAMPLMQTFNRQHRFRSLRSQKLRVQSKIKLKI